MTEDQLVAVIPDSRLRGSCRSCSAALTWYRTAAGRFMPFDGTPTVQKTETTAEGRDLAFLRAADSHFVTCPDAASFRKRKAARP